MYLSRLILNPRNRRVQKEVAEPYQMHRSLMNAFPDNLKPGEERVLFRLESQLRCGGLELLVQSLAPPDWSWLEAANARGYLLPVDVPNPAVKPFDLRLSNGQAFAFRLRANPTVKRTVDGEKKRLGLYREEEQLDWLRRKARQGGFGLIFARVSRKATMGGWAGRNNHRHRLRLLSVQFDGLLQVSDPDELVETVRCGVGSAKGLGFGLLSLAQPPA